MTSLLYILIIHSPLSYMNPKYSPNEPSTTKPDHSTVLQLGKRMTIDPPNQAILTQYLHVQYQVNNQLFNNQILLKAYLQNPNQSEVIGEADSCRAISSASEKILQNELRKKITPQTSAKSTIKKKKAPKLQIINSEEQQYQPSDEGNFGPRIYKVSETKNIPKNFGKAILRFIRKNQTTTSEVLQRLSLNETSFINMIISYKDKINTIAQLRSLWVEEENQFAQALRILSSIYLRKHSLNHIFNSRVQNHSKHIKYRQKMIKVIENPKNFTYIKDF